MECSGRTGDGVEGLLGTVGREATGRAVSVGDVEGRVVCKRRLG